MRLSWSPTDYDKSMLLYMRLSGSPIVLDKAI
jgi:hypothetical protein